MPAITVTAAISGALAPLTVVTDLLDAEGNILGYFTPVSKKDSELYEWALKNVDLAELERREKSGGPYYTTEQVLAHLRSLE